MLLFISVSVGAQINLTVEGIDYTMTTHNGYEIARSSPTNLIFRYNRITTNMDDGFLLMAGDNDYNVNAGNLDGAQIYGSRFISTNTTPSGSLHALMVGYNANYDIHHNYISSYDYGLTNEGGFPDHTSTINTSGGIYYNIFKNNLYNIVNKGHDGTKIYNNTFYSAFNEQGQFIAIKESDTGGLTAPLPGCKNTKIKNNIFYYAGSFSQFHAIRIGEDNDDTEAEMDTVGLEIDYNIYYYTNTTGNKPFFGFNGATLTWEQWRALGYDEHSVILDPEFADFNEFVPASIDIIDIGTDLGSSYNTGLSTNTTWAVGAAPDMEIQGTVWQVGARLYETEVIHPADYYVATDGNDSNPGTYELPWATWEEAFTNATAGDTVYIRGGVYYKADMDPYYVANSGTSDNPIVFANYPGEVPILDCGSYRPITDYNEPIYTSGKSYIDFIGLTVRNVLQVGGDFGNGVHGFYFYNGNQVRAISCTVHNVSGVGFLSNWDTDGGAGKHYFINCDAYNIIDTLSAAGYIAGRGTGFRCSHLGETLPLGETYFESCRAWNCSDQGFSLIFDAHSYALGCWSFDNGYYAEGVTDTGNGSGFKLGDSILDTDGVKRTVTNCIAAYNKHSGITTNENHADYSGRMNVYNNTLYMNGTGGEFSGYGFYILDADGATQELETNRRIFKNNIVYASAGQDVFVAPGAGWTNEYNSWNTPPGVTITSDDFTALPATREAGIALLMGARGTNGALPLLGNYFRLAAGSDAIDAGINVGLPYDGSAPDLGAFEYDGEVSDDATDILTFTLPTQTGAATINTTNHTVAIEVNHLATVTNLTPYIEVSYGATISPTSMTSRDFTTPQTYTVTALDGTTTQNWTVTVTQEEELYVPPEVDTSRMIKFNGGHLRKFRP